MATEPQGKIYLMSIGRTGVIKVRLVFGEDWVIRLFPDRSALDNFVENMGLEIVNSEGEEDENN